MNILRRNIWYYLGFCFVILAFSACGTGSGATQEELAELREHLDNREFEVQNQWADPLSGTRVNLIGNPNYIRFEQDSVDVFLPYFGVRHSGGYATEGGIKFEGIAENLELEEDGERTIVTFEGDNGSEHLEFRMIVFPNGNTDTSVFSSERESISYQGRLGPLPESFD